MIKNIYKILFGKKKTSIKTESVKREIFGFTKGKNTKVSGVIEIRQNGGKIIIGDDCLIEGNLYTETSKSKIEIGGNVYIGGGTILDSACEICIEDDVLISYACIIQDSDNHSLRYSVRKVDTSDWKNNRSHNWEVTNKKPIKISKGAWLGARVIILKGVTIGEGAIVGAGSVVAKNVPDWTIVAGNPAKIIREIPEDER